MQGLVGVDPEVGGHRLGDGAGVLGDEDEADEGVELELVEARARRFFDPGHLLPGAVGRHVGRRLGTPGAVAQVGVDADDVGVPCRERQDPPAAAAENEGRTRLLDRPGEERVLVHPVVVAVEGEGPVGAEQPLDDLHGLLEPLHPHPGVS